MCNFLMTRIFMSEFLLKKIQYEAISIVFSTPCCLYIKGQSFIRNDWYLFIYSQTVISFVIRKFTEY